MSSTEKTKFEQELNHNFSNGNLIESLELVISDAERKEKEYIKNNQLDKNKVKDFEKIIKETVFKNNQLEDYLNSLNKIEKFDMTIKRVCGINQLIPREVFFKDCGGYESIAEQFGEIFETAKEKEFINKIDSIAKLSVDNVDEVINKIEKIEDYLIITNYLNCDSIKSYDMYSDSIVIDDKKLEIMKIPQIENIYLIEKKYLPKLQYCNFDENFNKNNIDGNLYYELNDCSKDDCLRDEIIEKSSWLSEKGSVDEQQEYLKQQCRLRLFLAFRFCKIKYSKAVKFDVNEK